VPANPNFAGQEFRRDVDLEGRPLPELGVPIIQHAGGEVLRSHDPVELKFCKGYAHPSLISAKQQL
jgi:hypothetical protein